MFYQILVDRFRLRGGAKLTGDPQRPEFCGGDLWGVAERLDYLRELGVTTIWLSPINRTTAYHGYHVTDYGHVEERFGGQEALAHLIKSAQPDIRIIMDWVPNHVHREHPFFQDALLSPRSPYREWFFFDAKGRHRCFLDVAELPKLNLDHPAAREYIIKVALQWLDCGISGFRLDHVLGPSMDFWCKFREAIKHHAPHALLMGEALFAGMRCQFLPTINLPAKRRYLLASWLGLDVASSIMREYVDVFDALLDFEFQSLLKRLVAQARKPVRREAVQSLLDAHYASFPSAVSLASFLDNHDMDRFLYSAGGSQSRLQEAAEIQFSQDQPPIVYYGTEAGLSQEYSVSGDHGDLQARQMMPWNRPDQEMFAFYQKLIRQWKSRQLDSG